jgi:tetratricopeptide (TPR) repeat protein
MIRSFSTLLFLLFFVNISSAQQQLTLPQLSQKASLSQTVGLTDISITYHRPGVKGREIWGKLVPYDVVWRAGANENTTISFSDEVMIAGKTVPAGTYGLHFVPTQDEWTLILSKNYWSWGSFSYDETEDALRTIVKPVSAEHQEWLSYSFENPSVNSVEVVMHWEKLRVPFKIEIDNKKVVAEHFRKELDGLDQFFWQPWNQAANYSYQNNFDVDKALTWANRSININRNFQNLWTKANLLEKKGNSSEAETIRKEAWEISTEADINTLGYQYLFSNEIEKAIETFKKNVEDYPESWNVYDSLGEGYAAKGETELAIEYYKKAYDMVTDDTNKNRITNILKKLEAN